MAGADMKKPLTPKQQAFANAYAGNGTAAARLAGYQGSDDALGVTAHGLLRNPKIAAAIAARTAKSTRVIIASREDRQAFWTAMMQDGGAGPFERLKASELLGKSQADFTEKVEHSGALVVSVSINGIAKDGAE